MTTQTADTLKHHPEHSRLSTGGAGGKIPVAQMAPHGWQIFKKNYM